MRYISILFIFFATFIIKPSSVWSQDVRLETQLRSNTVYINDPIYVSFNIIGNSSNMKFSQPDLSNFEILSGPNQSTQHYFSEDNYGNVTQESSISFNYILRAKKTGTFQIKGANIKASNGKTISANAVSIKVVAQRSQSHDQYDDDMMEMLRRSQMAQQQLNDYRRRQEEAFQNPSIDYEDLSVNNINNNLFIKAEADKTKAVVGEQVNVTYKLYTRYQMSMNQTSKPPLNGFWAQDEKIEDPNTPHQENYNGKRYQVFTLRKVALFPQRSGTLTIDPIKAMGWVIAFEKANGEYYQTRTNKELESNSINIEVSDLPISEKPFSGAVGKFKANLSAGKNSFTTDDIIQLKFNIEGEGNIGLITAPSIKLPDGLSTINPDSKDKIFEIMPTLSGQKQFVYNISAANAGQYTIPAIDFTYFDPADNSYKTISTQELSIDVKQGNGSKSNIEEQNSSSMKDIHGINTSEVTINENNNFILQKWYYWLTILIGPLLLLINKLIVKGKTRSGKENEHNIDANKIAWSRLAIARNALQNNDNTAFYEEISKAIWLYLSDKFQIPLSSLNKDVLRQELKNRSIKESLLSKTIQQIENCELALYTPMNTTAQQNTLQNASDIITDFEDLFKK